MLLPLLITTTLLLQAGGGDAVPLLTDDLRFAENLARSRYFGLALNVAGEVRRDVEKLPDSADSRNLAGEAELTLARIIKRKAENTVDPAERMASTSAAIEKLQDWTGPGSTYAYHDRLVDALEDLAELLRTRGQLFAASAVAGDDVAKDKANTDFRLAEETYASMRKEAEALADQYEELEELDKATNLRQRAVNTYYFQGINSIEWSDTAADPALRLEQAAEQLDEFTWDADDQQVIFYYAQFEQARAYDKLGETDDASELLQSVLEHASELYWSELPSFPPSSQAIIATLFDKVWGYLARLEARQGDLDAAQLWIDKLRDEHRKVGVPVGREGFAVLLDWARTLDDLGQSGPATDLVKQVADQGRGTPEGQMAEIMLTELVAGGSVESPAVLMSAARGSYSEHAYSNAAFFFARAAALLGNPQEVAEYGFDAWVGAGQALRQLGRHLESALAYEQALLLEQAGKRDLGRLERSATGMYNGFDRRFKETGQDFDKQLRVAASERLIAMDGIELDLAFLSASEAFAELGDGDVQGYLAAKADFEGVPASSPNYERALVYIARCLAGAGRLAEAASQYAAIEARAKDPGLEPTNASARNRREIAMAQARYYHATLLLEDGLDKPAEALTVLQDYEQEVPGQADFHDLVKLRRVEAYARLGDVDAAEAALATLVGADPPASASVLAAAAYRTATALEQVARSETRPDKAAELLRRAADALWVYANADGFSSPVNVMAGGDWYLEVNRPADAEKVFTKGLEVMLRSGESAERIERARIGLATALDAQSDFGRSRTIWNELRAANPTSVRIRRGAARCFGGWLELADDGTVVEIGGSGDYEDALDIWVALVKGLNVKNKYTKPWWEAKLGTVYTYYKMRNLKPDAARSARKIIDNQKLSQPNYDADTMELLEPEQRYEPPFRDLFRYLDRQIPST